MNGPAPGARSARARRGERPDAAQRLEINLLALAPPPRPIYRGHKINTPRIPLLLPDGARYRRHPHPGGPPPPHLTARKPAGTA